MTAVPFPDAYFYFASSTLERARVRSLLVVVVRRRRRRLDGNRRVLLRARGRFHVSGPRACRVYRVYTLEGGINRSRAQISRSLLLRDVPRKRSAAGRARVERGPICIRRSLDFMPFCARTYRLSRKFSCARLLFVPSLTQREFITF